ncbi:MAG: hypothetical protein E6K78_03405 [Candidatus Eisenbacteria bacterium]|uniref:Rad50/SbcC-type AAA domain-containing protein n=1 Tax=Eiseniibacteriota bacterium TaxID=2212470 RepID=A0A538TW28_UNCEI|nr:MAG: hypothetical protein E6K78_03405 [Candidatus Eisenbacteria bacterium]
MKLLRLVADGFGSLRGEFTFDPQRLTLVVDDNERGKSTLLAAVVAALYGLDSDRRSHRPLTPLDRWRPWDGGSYRVELELESGGERITVARDFGAGQVQVWDAQGRDVTPDFRVGKDEFSVGRKLLALDEEEFEKCALVRQGDLLEVVALDEKERRVSPLRARLENAADTHIGDTNASEALRLLELALRKYTCPEVESSGTIDTAIRLLELKRATLGTELKALEHDLSRISQPLEDLAAFGEQEAATRRSLAEREADHHASLSAEVRRKLDENDERRAEVERLRAEAAELVSAARLPPSVEADFGKAVAGYEEALSRIQALEVRHRDETAREQSQLEHEIAGLAAYASGSAADADRCVSLAAELRRVAAEDTRLRDDIFNLRETLASQGHEPDRLQWLAHRLSRLQPSDHQLLRSQADLALAHQTEVEGLDQERVLGSETLRDIDAVRSRRRLPGWFLIAMGLAGLLAGVVVTALGGLPSFSGWFLTVGAVTLAAGGLVLVSARRLRASERSEALARLGEAQRRLTDLRTRRAEIEVQLETLAKDLGYRDRVELLREWSEHARLSDESGPALRAQGQLASLEAQRREALEEAHRLLERFGGGSPEPANLERVAEELRRLEGLRQRLAEPDTSWAWIDEERKVVEASAAGRKERALRILALAGLAYDPQRSWPEHATALAQRAQSKTRYAMLVAELIPAAEARLLPRDEQRLLEGQLAMTGPANQAASERPRRPPLEIEAESRQLRETLDALQQRRAELRLLVDGVWRRYHAEHPECVQQLERIESALARARRFKHAVELARETIQTVATETHRRWAEFLNRRVGELFGTLGTRIELVRFGDDLDFSVKPVGGPMLVRGKADHQLSHGARDQLYLAVRAAISEFLSRGAGPLPLLLDDVFATSDDDRTRCGMGLLLERLASQHQVVLVTCHRGRYEALAQLDPELYAERVHWLDLRAAGVPQR